MVVANIMSILKGDKPTKEYKGSPEMILITNGKVRLRFSFFSKSLSVSFSYSMLVLHGWVY